MGVLIMYRVKKVNGWNKYKIQKRFMVIFWRDVKAAVFISEGQAYLAWGNLMSIAKNKG